MAKIFFLSPYLRAGKKEGGIAPVARNLARRFAESGVEVVFLVFAAGLEESALGEGVRVLDVGLGPRLLTAFSVSRLLRREQPEALLAFGGRANLVASWAKRLAPKKTRVFASLHNNFSRQTLFGSKLASWWKKNLYGSSFSSLDGIFAVSSGVAQDFQKHTQSTVPAWTIPNPIDAKSIREMAKVPVNHPFLQNDAPFFLASGRLVPQKDFPTLMRAFALVRKDIPSRLAILGEGPERKNLEALAQALGIEQDLCMPGYVDNPFPWVAQARAFVLSSCFEGFGNVIAEALALGVPVVATDCPFGPREILEEGRLGALVPVGEEKSLAQAMKEAPTGRQTMAMASVDARFSPGAVARRYLEILLEKA